MKKVLFSLAALALVITGCEKLTELSTIERDVELEQTVEIAGLPNNADTVLPGQSITGDLPRIAIATESDAFLQENGASTASDKVEHVKLTRFLISMIEPANNNFDFIEDISVYISADGLGEVLAATKTDIPKGQAALELDCEGTNLKEYFLKDTIYVRMGGKFVSAPADSSKMQIKPTFNVKATLLSPGSE